MPSSKQQTKKPQNNKGVQKILSFPRPHPDTIAAILLLKLHGEKKFPGVKQAKVEFMTELPKGKDWKKLESEGALCVDIGEGRFDHHQKGREETFATKLVAEELDLIKDPALSKLLEYVRRDDLEGKGIVSRDKIDRAFGLSGLIMAMNRAYPDDPNKVLETVMTMFLAHIKEETKRTKLYPEEFEKAQKEKRFDLVSIMHKGRSLRVAFIESDVQGMVGFLRAYNKVKADIVVQRMKSGHTNVITNQRAEVDLRDLTSILRVEEARRKGIDIRRTDWTEWSKEGKNEQVGEWYYDTAANSIQNGGIYPDAFHPTRLSFEEVKDIVEVGLNTDLFAEPCPKKFCIKGQCYFYPYGLQRCRKLRYETMNPNK